MGINQLIVANGAESSHNSYMGGNAFEALVGAIYLDQGYDACMRFMKKRILKEVINIDKVAYKEVNFKSKLIEWSQKNRVKLDFRLLKQEKDKNGSPVFNYQVLLEGVEGCSASGLQQEGKPAESIETDARATASQNPSSSTRCSLPRASARRWRKQKIVTEDDKIPVSILDDEEFDLSDISAREQSREEIIAAAEAAAYEK